MTAVQTGVFAMIAGAIIGHVLFFAIYLWVKNKTSQSHRYLALLLLCLSVRVSKSVFLLIFPQFIFADILIALGVIAMSAIGPLVWLYISNVVFGFQNFKLSDVSHFIPGVLLSCFAFFLNDSQMFQVYQVTVYMIIGYIFFTVYKVFAQRKEISSQIRSWVASFLSSAAILSVIFLIQLYTSNFKLYTGVSVAAVAVLYTITLRAALTRQLPGTSRKKVHNPQLLDRISDTIASKTLFLDPDLNLNKLSREVDIPVHVVSSLINDGAGMPFPEYINGFRVREAEKKLSSGDWSMYTIEAIAYECGFNSVSAFYSSFKKLKNVSPARFRRQNFS